MFSWKLKNNKERDSGILKNPKILEVNLVKDNITNISFNWLPNVLVLAVTLIVASLFIAEIYYGLDSWKEEESTKTAGFHDQANKMSQELKSYQPQAMAALSYQARSLIFSNLLDNHVHWTNFFSWLEHRTLSNVKYQSFSGNLSGVYDLSASAKSFADASWQVNYFLKDEYNYIKKVKVSSVSYGSGVTKGGDKGVVAITDNSSSSKA